MSLSARAIFPLAILLLMTAPAIAEPPPLTATQMRQDLRYLRDVWAAKDKSFSARDREKFIAAVDAAISDADSLTPVEFSLQISRAVALAHNGHTNAELGPYFHHLPLQAAWFDDGLFIVRTAPSHARLLGARIDRFGALTAQQALERVAVLISGTPVHVRVLSPNYLCLLEVLHDIGATASPGEVKLRLTMPDGKRRTVTVGPESSASPERLPQHQQLIRRREDTPAPGRWPHVLDRVENLPLIYRRVVDVETDWLPGDEPVLYIRSNMIATATEDAPPFETKLRQAFEEVLLRRPRFVIIDLRFNSGGYLLHTVVVAHGLPRVLPADGKVFVLVGPQTWSAAIAMTAMLKGNGRERVVLVGDTMGDAPQFWAEGEPMSLPNSGISVQPAHGYHDWAEGCEGHPDCFWGNAAFARGGVSLEPEIRVATTFHDYVAGRDAVLEAALAEMKRELAPRTHRLPNDVAARPKPGTSGAEPVPKMGRRRSRQ